MLKIWKELDEFNGDYESTTARKPHSYRSDKKRTLEFDGKIKGMIDNDPIKSVRSVALDMRVSAFLTRQVVHEDIRYFCVAYVN